MLMRIQNFEKHPLNPTELEAVFPTLIMQFISITMHMKKCHLGGLAKAEMAGKRSFISQQCPRQADHSVALPGVSPPLPFYKRRIAHPHH